ncbi:MAG: hypothetical protein HY784_07965 [Chloroflexi bacterium]|nr:hypothetical protein [Chloroflexota bacterium]
MSPKRILRIGALPAGAFALALLAHAGTGLYSRYMADDYCTAGALRLYGFLGAQKGWYLSWSGRYAYTALVTALELPGPGIVPYLPAVALALWLTVLVWTLRPLLEFTGRRVAQLAALALAMSFLFTTLDGLPTVAQSLYWLTGMVTYVIPLILFSGYIGLLIRRQADTLVGRKAFLWMALSAGWVFWAGGFSEMFAALQLVFLSLAVLFMWQNGSKGQRRSALPMLVAGCIGAALAVAAVALAPGNRVRQALLPPPPGLLRLVQLSLQYTYRFLMEALTTRPLSLLSALVLPALLAFAVDAPDSPPAERRPGKLWAWAGYAAAALLLLVVCFAASAYGISSYPRDARC